ncbi:hypothetical protein DBV15_07423 [Temnothorax longispinosus]|uniref:Uncharacterized protein n=1 Tax=Temnothorax longispinosus TaxID=300112 RepID=A0A4S2JLM9_9HYME|nr:hypothetical protein DBV15_07423 [Temnothorax longispinosus]
MTQIPQYSETTTHQGKTSATIDSTPTASNGLNIKVVIAKSYNKNAQSSLRYVPAHALTILKAVSGNVDTQVNVVKDYRLEKKLFQLVEEDTKKRLIAYSNF